MGKMPSKKTFYAISIPFFLLVLFETYLIIIADSSSAKSIFGCVGVLYILVVSLAAQVHYAFSRVKQYTEILENRVATLERQLGRQIQE